MSDSKPRAARAEEAGKLWRQGSYGEARRLYEEVLSTTPPSLDRAKLLANIAQIYDKEGKKERAISTAEEALTVISSLGLYRSTKGTHLRGFLVGYLNRLKGRSSWPNSMSRFLWK